MQVVRFQTEPGSWDSTLAVSFVRHSVIVSKRTNSITLTVYDSQNRVKSTVFGSLRGRRLADEFSLVAQPDSRKMAIVLRLMCGLSELLQARIEGSVDPIRDVSESGFVISEILPDHGAPDWIRVSLMNSLAKIPSLSDRIPMLAMIESEAQIDAYRPLLDKFRRLEGVFILRDKDGAAWKLFSPGGLTHDLSPAEISDRLNAAIASTIPSHVLFVDAGADCDMEPLHWLAHRCLSRPLGEILIGNQYLAVFCRMAPFCHTPIMQVGRDLFLNDVLAITGVDIETVDTSPLAHFLSTHSDLDETARIHDCLESFRNRDPYVRSNGGGLSFGQRTRSKYIWLHGGDPARAALPNDLAAMSFENLIEELGVHLAASFGETRRNGVSYLLEMFGRFLDTSDAPQFVFDVFSGSSAEGIRWICEFDRPALFLLSEIPRTPFAATAHLLSSASDRIAVRHQELSPGALWTHFQFSDRQTFDLQPFSMQSDTSTECVIEVGRVANEVLFHSAYLRIVDSLARESEPDHRDISRVLENLPLTERGFKVLSLILGGMIDPARKQSIGRVLLEWGSAQTSKTIQHLIAVAVQYGFGDVLADLLARGKELNSHVAQSLAWQVISDRTSTEFESILDGATGLNDRDLARLRIANWLRSPSKAAVWPPSVTGPRLSEASWQDRRELAALTVLLGDLNGAGPHEFVQGVNLGREETLFLEGNLALREQGQPHGRQEISDEILLSRDEYAPLRQTDRDYELVQDFFAMPEAGRDVVCLITARNEAGKLPALFRHHKSLGIKHFVLIDNASSDRTVEIAAAQNCRIYRTYERYSASRFGVAWVNDILTRDFCGYWVLVLDADELFVYPNCENQTIDGLTERLEALGYEGLPAVLVDMYPPSPINDAQLTAESDLRELYRYYDCGNYVFTPVLSCPLLSCWGGARSRVFKFGVSASLSHMALNKVPLVKWSAEISYLSSTHTVTPLRLPSFWAVLEHYKYMPDFAVRARQEAIRREHWAGASEYRAYAEVLEASPTFTFMNRLSRERTQSRQFVDAISPFAWPTVWQ